jgi:hypothetical protein
VTGFIPLLTTIDGLNNVATKVDVDMAMGENWLVREPLVAIYKKVIAEEFNGKVGSFESSQLLLLISSLFGIE